jgi:hypothetical protein
MTIPSGLHQQIVEKAQQMNMGFDEAVTTLLRIGLETQIRREAELEGLVEDFRSGADMGSEKKRRLGDELGGAIFGR